MKPIHIVVCALLSAAAAIATLFWYPALPASVPIHWDASGKVDGFGPRSLLWLLGPGLMAAILLIGLCLPWLSPRRFNLERFKATYSYYISVLVATLGCFYVSHLYVALGNPLPMERIVPTGVFVLLILLGNPLGKVKPNFYVGIRTPWTLASESVWHATHRLGAKLMVASGLLGLLAMPFNTNPWILIALCCAWAPMCVVYSLVCAKRLEHEVN